ncbi:MAG: hypothetical protein WC803_13535 [Sphingomonas sp.]|jgi:hypothetical protein
MPQFASYTTLSHLQNHTVHSGSAAELQRLARASIAIMVIVGSDVLANIRLSGCGDGKEFALHLEGIPTEDVGTTVVYGEADVPAPPVLSTLTLTCFQAGHPRDIEAARAVALAGLATHDILSTDIAGAQKGTAIMGVIISRAV